MLSMKHPKGAAVRRWRPAVVVAVAANEPDYYDAVREFDSSGFAALFARSAKTVDRHSEDDDWRRLMRRLSEDAASGDIGAMRTYATLSVLLNGHVGSIRYHLRQQQQQQECSRLQQSSAVPGTGDTDFSLDVADDQYLQEAWTYLQDTVSWESCVEIHQFVCRNLDVIQVVSPLEEFAKRSIFLNHGPDVDRGLEICRRRKWIDERSTGDTDEDNMLRVSHQLMDHVKQQPRWIAGVIGSRTVSSGTTVEIEPVSRSCIPTCYIDLRILDEGGGDDDNSSSSNSNNNNKNEAECLLLANYDIFDCDEVSVERRPNDSTVPGCDRCSCYKCQYETNGGIPEDVTAQMAVTKIRGWQHLANHYFGTGEYAKAETVFWFCHSVYSDIIDADQPAENAIVRRLRADTWHAIGALKLAQLQFVQAQRHWNNGRRYAKHCNGLATQITKIDAYRHLQNRQGQSEMTRPLPPFQSHGYLHIATECVDADTCRKLIGYATEYAAGQNGWTTNRHYAVPTIDIPVHEVPDMLRWLLRWMDEFMEPLLHRQFGTDPAVQRYYVHDAFLARYEKAAEEGVSDADPATTASAKKSSTFLPLHFDESTHSFVLALNDDFEGGGTYFHDIDRVVAPSVGAVASFRGNRMLHGGRPVTKGIRYIIAGFLYLDDACRSDAADRNSRKRTLAEILQSSSASSSGGGGRKEVADGGTNRGEDAAFSFGFFQ